MDNRRANARPRIRGLSNSCDPTAFSRSLDSCWAQQKNTSRCCEAGTRRDTGDSGTALRTAERERVLKHWKLADFRKALDNLDGAKQSLECSANRPRAPSATSPSNQGSVYVTDTHPLVRY
jgi:hypothetical protein